ncbi:uncharacterized protein BDZ83DRAFT_647501 [Colletotrichum acutatum]|uniref:Uncharacterized protein n=1 Tax=Glomerella acutata TaxID=27357 RepID=A0AAD8XM77_GLOAC|nr:uncharacterized protein BDZ83DRAFT_647501 [Colletotrichum acutatum]KAK1729946.1 hypothetical protein BDZ83DRAFT_647501 [Colletotrichum acutatum]
MCTGDAQCWTVDVFSILYWPLNVGRIEAQTYCIDESKVLAKVASNDKVVGSGSSIIVCTSACKLHTIASEASLAPFRGTFRERDGISPLQAGGPRTLKTTEPGRQLSNDRGAVQVPTLPDVRNTNETSVARGFLLSAKVGWAARQDDQRAVSQRSVANYVAEKRRIQWSGHEPGQGHRGW